MKVDGNKILVSQDDIVETRHLMLILKEIFFKAVLDKTLKIFSEMKDSLVKPERYPAKKPGYVEDSDEDCDEDSDEYSDEDSE